MLIQRVNTFIHLARKLQFIKPAQVQIMEYHARILHQISAAQLKTP
jgi:hypothetical protein